LYGALAVLVLLLVGADVVYFKRIAAPASAQTAAPASVQGDAEDQACFYNTELAAVKDLSVLIDERDPYAGNPDGAVTVIEIFDPNCPHCKTLHPTMQALLAKYEDQARFVYKPVAGFQPSVLQNAVLFAADEAGKFSEMLDLQFERQRRGGLTRKQLKELAVSIGMDGNAMEQRIEEGAYADLVERAGRQVTGVGVESVPTVLINGRFVASQSRSEACLSQFIEEELRNAGAEG
jgi:protein-disulfide isomerase